MVENIFLKVLKSCGSPPLVKWIWTVFALSQALLSTGWPDSYDLKNEETFDFVVVGAGSAGAIVAARLSEIHGFTVLLIEAGGDPPFASVTPSLFVTLAHTEHDWDYKAFMDPGVGEAHFNRTIFMTRGKMLGGSSSNNYEVYARGVPQDYNEWGEIAPGWDWDSTLPYFKKLENMADPIVTDNLNNTYLHSTNGPVGISRPKTNSNFEFINENMLNAFQEIGIKKVLENNGPQTLGVSRPHFTFMNGRRSSTAEAYLREERPNLRITKNSKVTRVLIDHSISKAYGVEVLLKSNEKVNIFARKEVIISAGTIDSPKLLMLSGIGPKKQLAKLKIDIVVDLPVGENLHDHQFVPLVFQGRRGLQSVLDNLAIFQELDSYPVPIQSGLFVVNRNSTKPEFQFFNIHVGAAASPLVEFLCRSVTNYDESFCFSVGGANIIREIFIAPLLLLHPKSRGHVRLRSSNHMDEPIINMGYFRNKDDLDSISEGVKYMRRLLKTTYFRSIGANMAKLDVNGCNNEKEGTLKYWRCYCLNTVGSLMHPSGTCAMGPNGVVDEKLRVHGVANLRVVDASVIPKIPSGNTNVPTMMIGEKAADLIKLDYVKHL